MLEWCILEKYNWPFITNGLWFIILCPTIKNGLKESDRHLEWIEGGLPSQIYGEHFYVSKKENFHVFKDDLLDVNLASIDCIVL